MAEAAYDCRPPPCAFHRARTEINRFFAASPTASGLALAALPYDPVVAFNVRAFSPDGDCITRSHRRRVRISEKCSAAGLHSVSICTSRSGTYVEQLDYLDGARAVSGGP